MRSCEFSLALPKLSGRSFSRLGAACGTTHGRLGSAFSSAAALLALVDLGLLAAAAAARFCTSDFSGRVGRRIFLFSAARRSASAFAAASACSSSAVLMEMRTTGGATAASSSLTPHMARISDCDGAADARGGRRRLRAQFFNIGKRKTIEIRKLDEAVFGINPLHCGDERFDDGLFGNVKRERFFAGFQSEERAPVQFVENEAEALALTHTACSTANQTRNSGHSDATIRRQSLQKDAQNRSSNHKTSPNYTCRRGKIHRTTKT